MAEAEASPNGTQPVETSPQALEHLHRLAELADAALRRNALLESGVELDTPLGKLFVRALEKEPKWTEQVPTPEWVRSVARGYEMPLKGENR